MCCSRHVRLAVLLVLRCARGAAERGDVPEKERDMQEKDRRLVRLPHRLRTDGSYRLEHVREGRRRECKTTRDLRAAIKSWC